MTQELQKFLFDRLNFDHGAGYLPEHPPEPTFTSHELADAHARGITEGRTQAFKESQDSRDQKIIDLTQKITTATTALLSQESERSALYQNDVLKLIGALFQKAYPLLNNTYGLPQILETIKQVLSDLDEKAVVIIEVSTDDVNELSDRLKSFILQHNGQITILPHTDLVAGTCRMKWQDGGMIRDPQETAQKMIDALQETLKNAI